MTRLRFAHVLLLTPLVAIAAWVGARGRATVQDPAAVLVALRDAQGPRLPSPAAAGAARCSEPTNYNRDTLYQYIDGAAESYLSRGFERCVAASFTFGGDDALEVVAEVYRFVEPASARAQLEAERPGAARPLVGITDTWADDTALVAVNGHDYLKLTAMASNPAVKTAMAGLAAAWAKAKPR
ncbi:MAG: DUF6599 family protein [Thermoanaerobaculales bacterium]